MACRFLLLLLCLVVAVSCKKRQQISVTLSAKKMGYASALKFCAAKKLVMVPKSLRHLKTHHKLRKAVGKAGVWVCKARCGKKNSVGAVVAKDGKIRNAKPKSKHYAACVARVKLTVTRKRRSAPAYGRRRRRRRRRFKRFIWRRRRRHHRRRHHRHRHHRRHHRRHRRRHHRRRPYFRRPRRNSDCTCTASGDPHYRTFDGARYSFQSICRYILATSTARHNCRFSIEAQNTARGRNRRVSYLHYVVVKLNGREYRMMRGRRMRVNGRYVRYYNRNGIQIRIVHGRMVFSSGQCGIRILYDGNAWAAVYINRGFYGRRVQGVCGNCDGNQHNDWRTRTGQFIHRRGGLYNAEAIGRSWAVPSDDGRVCLRRRPPPPQPVCNRQRSRFAAAKCAILMQHQVVFKACIARGIIRKNFQAMYSECVMDVCALGHSSHLAKQITCQSAKLMSDRCRAGGVPIPNWRATYNCPAPRPPPPQNVCDLPPQRGPCRGSHTRFFFNKQTGTCRPFSYGGCGGNPNRFEKYTDCLTECGGKIKPKPTDCSSNEISAVLLQKIRIMIQQLMGPTHQHITSLVSVINMMQQTTTQFQVMMKLFIQMRQLKAQQDMFTKYVNLRQSIAQIMAVIKHGINKRYEFEDNIFIKQNTNIILRVIEGYKLIKKVYIGQEKTNAFITAFNRRNRADSGQMFNILKGLLVQGHGTLDIKKIEAVRVLMPTLMLSGMEELSQSAFLNNNKKLIDLTDLQLDRIQTLSTTVKQHVKINTKITI